MILTIWLAAGIAFFFLARASWGLTFNGCKPITIGTVIGLLFVMWVPPLSLMAAVAWAVMWLIEEDYFDFLQIEVANPCRWFARDDGDPLP